MIVFDFKFKDSSGEEYNIEFLPELNKALYITCSNRKFVFNNGYDSLVYNYDQPEHLKNVLERYELPELAKFIYKLLDNRAFW